MKNVFVISLAEYLGFIQGPGLHGERDLKNRLKLVDAVEYFSILTIATFSGWVLANLFANTGIPHRGLDPVLTHSDWSLQGKSILTTAGVVALFVTIHLAMACFMHVLTVPNLKTSAWFKVEYRHGIPKYNLYFENALEFVAVWLFSAYVISLVLELIVNRRAKSKQT